MHDVLLMALRYADIDCAFCRHAEENADACDAADCDCEVCAHRVCPCQRCNEDRSMWTWCGEEEALRRIKRMRGADDAAYDVDRAKLENGGAHDGAR